MNPADLSVFNINKALYKLTSKMAAVISFVISSMNKGRDEGD